MSEYADRKAIGRRIAAQRVVQGKKQFEINELLDRSDKYMSQVESGKTLPSVEALMKICSILQTTPNHILLGSSHSGSSALTSAQNGHDVLCDKVKGISTEKGLALLSDFIDSLKKQDL